MAKYIYDKYNATISYGNYTAGTVVASGSASFTFTREPLATSVDYYNSYTFSAYSGYSGAGPRLTVPIGDPPPTGFYYFAAGMWKILSTTNVINGVTHRRYDHYPQNQPTYYSRGTHIMDIVAEDGTYPANGRHSDGYWYVRGGLANATPTLTLSTTNARTLYENDTFAVTGTSKDLDVGNVVSVKYTINGGTARAISTAISTGADIPFGKVLTFKNKRLYDGATSITADLLEGAQHTLRVWAEDDQGGKSADVVRTFQVVANRAPMLTISQTTDKSNLIDTDNVTISGNVSDLDGNSVVVEYKVGSGSYAQVYSGSGGSFTINLQLKALKVGANPVSIRATDSYGATTIRNLSVAKTEDAIPLKESVQRYKITPPNGSAKGVVLWIERETGDLVVSAEISMTGVGEDESFEPMTLNSTAFVGATRDEDEFQYESDAEKEEIVVKLTMVRADTASPQAIRLVSGVLS